jgi:hypothetical protein
MSQRARPGRLFLVLLAIAGVIWMHALVAAPPTVANPHTPGLVQAEAEPAGDDRPAPAEDDHHGGLGAAHCLAVLSLAVGILAGLGLGARRDVARSLGTADVIDERPATVRSARPPDLVRELSISRT